MTPEQHIRQIIGTHHADLIVQLAVARARVDELEQELVALKSPAPKTEEAPRDA